MRNLTIKREKSFVACLVKMKVYIADPEAGQMVINGIKCRKLGTLKNGEEKTFEIGDVAARVFVIGDSLSKNFCNDYYDIPEGTEDIRLVGRNKYNPASGNAFRFDGNDLPPDVIENRKKGTRKGAIILVVCIAIGFVVGFLLSSGVFSKLNVKPQAFYDSGVKIVLTNEFAKVDHENYTVCYGSEDVAVLVIKEAFADYEGSEDYTVRDYGEIVLENNQLTSELKTHDGLTYFVYENYGENNKFFQYYAFTYKSDDAFWLVQFAVVDKDASEYEADIFEWAESVEFY